MTRTTDWNTLWNTAPAMMGGTDFLRQVGKTVNGVPVSEASINIIVDGITSMLKIQPNDHVLDLCCGNGMITARCAAYCGGIVGVDYSRPLIDIANRYFKRENVEYIFADVMQLPESLKGRVFTKVYMYEAIQHLETEDMMLVLDGVRRSLAEGAPVLLGSIPDKDRLWNFYDTPARREEYHRRTEDGTEVIGRWWGKGELKGLAERCGYRMEAAAQDARLHTAHYRFDAVLYPS